MHYTIPVNTVSLLEQIDVWHLEFSMCAIIRDEITKKTVDHVLYHFRGSLLALDFDSVNSWIKDQCVDPQTLENASTAVDEMVDGFEMDSPRLINLQVSVHKIEKIMGGVEITNDVAKLLPKLIEDKENTSDPEHPNNPIE